jgi:pyruvate/2-oxoglutarate dehydrogenase complex dihydrolipoamide acyltransferase (E2) component
MLLARTIDEREWLSNQRRAFTVVSHGTVGGLAVTPTMPMPQGGILDVGATESACYVASVDSDPGGDRQ